MFLKMKTLHEIYCYFLGMFNVLLLFHINYFFSRDSSSKVFLDRNTRILHNRWWNDYMDKAYV